MRLTTARSRISNAPSRIATLTQSPTATPRMRGRKAVDRRARWLSEHPYCEHCKAEGRFIVAAVVDHIVPLWKGGEDNFDTNGQSLCHAHHDKKSAKEAAERAKGR